MTLDKDIPCLFKYYYHNIVTCVFLCLFRDLLGACNALLINHSYKNKIFHGYRFSNSWELPCIYSLLLALPSKLQRHLSLSNTENIMIQYGTCRKYKLAYSWCKKYILALSFIGPIHLIKIANFLKINAGTKDFRDKGCF